MTPPAGRAGATGPDLGTRRRAATAATGMPVLACTVAAGGPRRGGRALVTHGGADRCATQHRYQACQDEGCERFACRVYREGYRARYGAGYGVGYSDGEAAGYAEGHADGYAAGAASASGSR